VSNQLVARENLTARVKILNEIDLLSIPLEGYIHQSGGAPFHTQRSSSSQRHERSPAAEWNITNSHNMNLHAYFEFIKNMLANKRVVLIGDSLTRYQYMNLIHALHFNSWRISRPPHIEVETEWDVDNWAGEKEWKNYFKSSSLRFGCAEICDCYRINSPGFVKCRENRHYYNSDFNFSISMLLWLPPNRIKLNPFPSLDLMNKRCQNYDVFETVNTHGEQHTMEHDLLTLLDSVIQPLDVDILIVNQGFWEKFNGFQRNVLTSIDPYAIKIMNSSKRSIWKTTTPNQDNEKFDSDLFLDYLQSFGVEIFETFEYISDIKNKLIASVGTERMKSQVYWDSVHFLPWIYTLLNQKLLDQLFPF